MIEWVVVAASHTYIQTASPSLSVCRSALYWALTTLTTVGYGDIIPVTNGERIFVLLLYLVGSVIYASIFAFVTTAVTKFFVS